MFEARTFPLELVKHLGRARYCQVAAQDSPRPWSLWLGTGHLEASCGAPSGRSRAESAPVSSRTRHIQRMPTSRASAGFRVSARGEFAPTACQKAPPAEHGRPHPPSLWCNNKHETFKFAFRCVLLQSIRSACSSWQALMPASSECRAGVVPSCCASVGLGAFCACVGNTYAVSFCGMQVCARRDVVA
jgi:hypothetical protein